MSNEAKKAAAFEKSAGSRFSGYVDECARLSREFEVKVGELRDVEMEEAGVEWVKLNIEDGACIERIESMKREVEELGRREREGMRVYEELKEELRVLKGQV